MSELGPGMAQKDEPVAQMELEEGEVSREVDEVILDPRKTAVDEKEEGEVLPTPCIFFAGPLRHQSR